MRDGQLSEGGSGACGRGGDHGEMGVVRADLQPGRVLSHPSAIRLRMDGAHGKSRRNSTVGFRAVPGLRSETWGTQRWWWIPMWATRLSAFPPIRDKAADGWGTR
jgi:hypothetical protein